MYVCVCVCAGACTCVPAADCLFVFIIQLLVRECVSVCVIQHETVLSSLLMYACVRLGLTEKIDRVFSVCYLKHE